MDFLFFLTRLENEEHSFPDYVPTHINSLSSKLLITTCLKDSLEKGNLNKGTFSITINYRLIFEVWDRLVMEGKLRTKKCIVGSSSKCEGGGREKKNSLSFAFGNCFWYFQNLAMLSSSKDNMYLKGCYQLHTQNYNH